MVHQHATSDYMAHGFCFSWEPGLVWIHVASDIATGIAYYSIALALLYYAYKRRDITFYGLLISFAAFILACGTTHFFAAYTVYDPTYWQEGYVKAFTALISIASAIYFIPQMPKALDMPSLAKSLDENRELNSKLTKAVQALQDSNSFNQSIIDSSTDCINLLDLKGRLQYMSPRGQLKFGIKSIDEFINVPYENFWKGEDHTAALGAITNAQQGHQGSFEGYSPTQEGTPKWWEVIITPVKGADGHPEKLLAVSRDITARKQSETELLLRGEALANSERFLKTIIDSEPECIKMLDIDGNLLMMNRAGLEIIEADSFEQVKGKCVLPLVTDTYKDAFMVLTKQVFQGNSGTLEFESIGLKGRHSWLESHAVPFRDERGEIVALLGITRDITEGKRLEEERQSLEKQVLHAQKLESLGVLAGGIAHDFNNILMAIIGNADLALMRINKESPVIENLHRIEQAAARAADLAKQMLAYSGKGKFVIEDLDLNILMEEMLHMLEVSISKKAVLRLNLTSSLPTVEADATQIRQIVMNLVINASEAVGEKSGVIAISTGCMDCDKSYLKDVWLAENLMSGLYVYLEIADNGCGMDKTTLSKLFDPFFTTKFTGRGLGMAAVHGIVRGHKGAIRVYSEPDKGSTFKILLPASNRPPEIFNGTTHHDDWKGHGKVLLVDDEETVRGIGSEMLKELGFTPITANDGIEAVEQFNNNPDIAFVILDLTMPHMDGEQCFRELKKLKSDVKVIISSGFSEHEVTQKFAGKGLSGFIQKPYKLSVLKETLQKI